MLDVINVIGTLVMAAVGWLATHYVAGPVLALHRLRQRIHEELFYTANVGWITMDGNITPEEQSRYDDAVRELRRLAAQVSALHSTWPRHLRWYLSTQKFRLDAATKGLTGLSNGLADPADHTGLVDQIENALSLPQSYLDELRANLQAIQKRRMQRS